MNIIDEYFKLQKTVHDYFGYVEDWKIIPLSDLRGYYWHITNENDGSVLFSDYRENLTKDGLENYYEYSIYTQRFLPKYVYRGDEYTLVSSDTHTDGNKVLAIFDNKLEVTELG